MDDNLMVAIVFATAIVATTALLIVRMVFKKDERLAEIRARGAVAADPALNETLEGLRKEIVQLRDTSTQYDVSFDAALQRLEGRVARLEQNAVSGEGRQIGTSR